MYAYFIGRISKISADRIILETNNIGYNIYMPLSDIQGLAIGDDVKIYTYTSVKEDSFVLYGFTSEQELSFFKLLLTVNGVGPRAALAMLSNTTVDNLMMAIIAGDTKELSKVPGIGSKTAGRIILDLKDKVNSADLLGYAASDDTMESLPTGPVALKSEACEALCALGYSATEAMRAINRVENMEECDVSELIRAALVLM